MLSLSDLMWEPDVTWRTDAACSGVDSDIFFPTIEDDPKSVAQAKEICAECPAQGGVPAICPRHEPDRRCLGWPRCRRPQADAAPDQGQGTTAGVVTPRVRRVSAGRQYPHAMRLFLIRTAVFVSAAAVLVLEIVAGRIMAPYVGVSLQTFTGIIGTILAAIALGAWAGGRAADGETRKSPRTGADRWRHPRRCVAQRSCT